MDNLSEETNPFISEHFSLEKLSIIYEALDFHIQDDDEEHKALSIANLVSKFNMSEEDAIHEYEEVQPTPEEKETVRSLIVDILNAMDVIEARESAPDMIQDIEDFLDRNGPS